MKQFKDMTDSEFKKASSKAEIIELSPFAKFCHDLRGYEFYRSGWQVIYKWEIWDMGYQNAEDIIHNRTPIIASKK